MTTKDKLVSQARRILVKATKRGNPSAVKYARKYPLENLKKEQLEKMIKGYKESR